MAIKLFIAAAAAGMLVSVVSAGACKTRMSDFRTADLNLATNYGGAALNAAMFYPVLKQNIEELEATTGSLQAQPINLGTAAGTSTMNMTWSSLIVSLAKKLAASPASDEDLRYLLAPMGEAASSIHSAVTYCSPQSDGASNVVRMIEQARDRGVLPLFLGRATIYLKGGRPGAGPGKTEGDVLPFSKMEPI